MKQVDKLITGMAGEYLVAGQMSLRGWTANLTYKNYPGVDIIGQHHRLGDNTIAKIQVKASEYQSFWVGVKHSQREQMGKLIKGPYVLVFFDNEKNPVEPHYYILTKQQMIDLIIQSDDAWRKKLNKRPDSPDYSIKVYIGRDKLYHFENKWESLFVID